MHVLEGVSQSALLLTLHHFAASAFDERHHPMASSCD